MPVTEPCGLVSHLKMDFEVEILSFQTIFVSLRNSIGNMLKKKSKEFYFLPFYPFLSKELTGKLCENKLRNFGYLMTEISNEYGKRLIYRKFVEILNRNSQ